MRFGACGFEPRSRHLAFAPHTPASMIHYLSPRKLLFLSPWRPVETDTSACEGAPWECPSCMAERTYFRSLARLEGADGLFMVQCPACDHLAVLQAQCAEAPAMTVHYLGPHVDEFLVYLNEINSRHDALER